MAHSMTSSTTTASEPAERASQYREALWALLDPVVASVLHDPGLRQLVPREVAIYLVHSCGPFPWFNHLALASVIYASSRVADPRACLERVHRFLRWAIPQHFPDLASLHLQPALIAYFGDPPQPRGYHAFKAYSALQLHLERFLNALTAEQRTALAPFLLPPLLYSSALNRLASRSREKTRQTRKAKAFAVVNHLPELVALARRRYRWLSELDTQLQQVCAAVQRGETPLPTKITLKSLENREDLHFRVWHRTSWSLAHPAAVPSARRGGAGSVNPPEGFFLQLVGVLPEHPWFLRALACEALQGAQSPSAEARHYLAEWGMGFLNWRQAGLLNPEAAMNATLNLARQTAAGTPEDSAVLFELDPLLAAAAVGLFVVVSVASSGMRIGELQQVTLDRDCMELLDLPEYDDRTGKWIQGPSRVYWRLYPKGRHQRERYLVTPYMTEALFLLLDLHTRFFGAHSLRAVPCCSLESFTHMRQFPGQHKFVLQWGGHHLSMQGLTQSLRFLLLEQGCRDERGQPVSLTVHLLRHGVAGWLRRKGFPLEEIMGLLKQVNITVTDYYSQLSPEDLHQQMGPVLTTLCELAGTDPAWIRSAEDIRRLAQEALKQYGVLRRTPGGACGTFDPCMVHFACATCRFYVPDPQRRAEVATKLILSEKIVAWRREAGDYMEADNEQVHRHEWERILQEMDALEQVPLLSPSAESVLQSVSEGDVTDLFLPPPAKNRGRLARGEGSDG
jgi:hypothetical protein